MYYLPHQTLVRCRRVGLLVLFVVLAVAGASSAFAANGWWFTSCVSHSDWVTATCAGYPYTNEWDDSGTGQHMTQVSTCSGTSTGAHRASTTNGVLDWEVDDTPTVCNLDSEVAAQTAPTDAEVYAACLEIFGALLGALSVVWGVKQVYRTLDFSRNEG